MGCCFGKDPERKPLIKGKHAQVSPGMVDLGFVTASESISDDEGPDGDYVPMTVQRGARPKTTARHEPVCPPPLGVPFEVIGGIRAEVGDRASHEDMPDLTVARFALARDCDVPKAALMLSKALDFRESFRPWNIAFAGPVQRELELGKLVYLGFDRDRRPAFLFWAGRHMASESKVEDSVAMVVFIMESVIAYTRRVGMPEELTLLIDFTGFGYANIDFSMVNTVLEIMQEYYPEMLGAAYIINEPWIFSSVWKTVKGWIGERTEKRIVFASLLEDPQQELRRRFGEDLLPVEHGGTRTSALAWSSSFLSATVNDAVTITPFIAPVSSRSPRPSVSPVDLNTPVQVVVSVWSAGAQPIALKVLSTDTYATVRSRACFSWGIIGESVHSRRLETSEDCNVDLSALIGTEPLQNLRLV